MCTLCDGTVVGGVCVTNEEMSTGAIAGIVIGVLVALSLIGVLVWFLLYRRAKEKAKLESEKK